MHACLIPGSHIRLSVIDVISQGPIPELLREMLS